jgi:thiamine-phosphate pyrophosphorylase
MAVVDSAAAGLRAIDNGATILQLRAPHLSARELERECRQLVRASRVPVVLSSRCDIALACDAAGVNLPERDLAVADARALLGDRIVGRSVHSPDAAAVAMQEAADYVLFGPVWASPTHADRSPLGLEALRRVVRSVHVPVLAIGGVDRERGLECIDAGAAGYAAIRMFA